jgi:cytochrome P450
MNASRLQEDVGDTWLAPVRFRPYVELRSQLEIVLSARDDLLSNWRDADFRAAVTDFRIFNRQLVIVNTPDGVKHVLSTHNDNYERKSPQMRRALEFLLGDGLFISDGGTWSARRPLVAAIVGKNRVPGFGAAMTQAARDMADEWAARDPAQPLDLLNEMGVLTSEIIARTLFGVPLGRRRAETVIRSFAEYQRRIDSFNVGYLLGFDEGLPVWKGLGLRRATRRIQKVVDQVIGDHLDGRGDHTVMLDMLAIRQQRRPEAGVGRDALRDEAATLFMAGHETTASTLAWAWYLLAKAPWAELAVQREIESVCGDRPPTFEDVQGLVYCRAVVEETLRLYPPVAILARQARERDVIGRITVEPAAVVMISPWLLHRSPDLWDRPNHFLPERFLGEARPSTYAYVPFAVGPRACPGMTFGLVESVICLATLAQRFRFRLPPGVTVAPQCRLTLRPKSGVPMLVAAR